jgi:hypothetical protein
MSFSARTMIVEARDLDTDERRVAKFNVQMPFDECGRRAQLESIVTHLYPHARMRSFEDRAASFLDAQSLVVAHYGQGDQQPALATSSPAERLEQQSLFTA